MSAWAVFDRTDECYAIRRTRAEAVDALKQANEYLREAGDCGHPRARGWVAERTPLEIVPLTAAQVDEERANGVPVLDREP